MACSVSPILSGSFGSCSVDIEESNFNKDSTFWYIENENSVYNFKLTLCPYLSATPLKIFYPVVEVIDVQSFQKTLAFPPFNQYLPSTYNSLLDFSFCNQENGAEYNIVSIDEPVVSFNSVDNIFDFSFIGRFREGINAFSIFNYRFLKNNQILNPYSVNVYSPNQLIFSTNFAEGYLSPLLDIQTYPKSVGPYLYPQPNLDYNTCPVEDYPCPYVPPCQDITVAHNLQNKTLKFNSNSFNALSTFAHNVTFLNYISGLDPQKEITIIFDAAAYYYTSNDKYLTTYNSSNICNARLVGENTSATPGEGFCVYFYQLTSYKDFIGSGPNSCFGYAPGSAVMVDETNGYYLNFNQGMYGGYAGVGFDIGGNFSTYTDGKTVSGSPVSSYPNTITIRAGQYEKFEVLQTTNNLNQYNLSLVQAISSIDDLKFNTYRVILDNSANRIKVGVLDCVTNEFVDVCCQELNYQINCDQFPSILFTGLSFSTGSNACHFELKNYSVVGRSIVPEVGDACGRTHINTPTPTCPLVFVTNTPTPTSSETTTPTPTPTKTTTPTPTITRTPQKSPTPTTSPTPTPTVTTTPTVTPTNTITPTPTVTPTNGFIAASPTPTTTVTPTVTPSSTPPKSGGKTLCLITPTDNGIYLQSWNACRAYIKRELDAQLPPVNGAYSDIWKILQYINFRMPIIQNIGTQAVGVNTWGGFGTTKQSYYVTFSSTTSNARNPSYNGSATIRSNLDNSIIAEIATLDYTFTGEPPKNFNTEYEGENNITWCPLIVNQIKVS